MDRSEVQGLGCAVFGQASKFVERDASPFQGFKFRFEQRTQGCASLHPGLLVQRPSGTGRMGMSAIFTDKNVCPIDFAILCAG